MLDVEGQDIKSGAALPEESMVVAEPDQGKDAHERNSATVSETHVCCPILPWVNGDGSTNTIVYKGLTRRLLGTVMQNPGILEEDIIWRMDVLNPQMKLIWKELGPKFKELLELGKPGVVDSILAACERLQTLSHECCHALSTAVNLDSESPSFIVPHIQFLESYFRDKSSWKWPPYDKMHVLGCLMLQIIFRYPMQLIQPFVMSLTSMDTAHVLQTAKDAGGGRVIEAFLSSDVSTKMKLKVVTKLQDHYAELAMGIASSFTVEKCFASSNVSLKENIAIELLAARAELSKTKHGPYLLKKLDIDGWK
ncbi:hypothetical protein Cni_G07584 [Canna indica]|uniref:Uncharacterized protein n=1 Tax=Canna indica TaxID=4628 RepID=A0AAQ3Q7H5_9LILI|nr:hypothetical protein Cni_G07584 [Canna indica]